MKLVAFLITVCLALLTNPFAVAADVPALSDEAVTFTIEGTDTDLITGAVTVFSPSELSDQALEDSSGTTATASCPAGGGSKSINRIVTGYNSHNNIVFKFHGQFYFKYNCQSVIGIYTQDAFFSDFSDSWHSLGSHKEKINQGAPTAQAYAYGNAQRCIQNAIVAGQQANGCSDAVPSINVVLHARGTTETYKAIS